MAHPHPLAQKLLSREPRTAHLPTELLLEIFLRVALLHPDSSTLHSLTAANQEWRAVFKTYEGILWRTAAFSAFPGACFSPAFSVDDVDSIEAEYWRETFLIHSGWASRRALTTVVVVPGPPPSSSSPSSSSTPSSSPSDPTRQAMGSDTSLTAPVVVSIQEATALLLQGSGSDSGPGLMSMSSSQSHQHQHHHHHQYQHQHHVHDHHLLMDQPHLSLDSMHRGESSATANTHGHKQQQQQNACTTATTNTARMSPPLLSTDVNVSEILSCSLCTYSDVCLIPQAKIVVRTYRTRTGGPLMQVLDWAMQYSVDLGPRRRDDGEMSDPEDANDESDGETDTESVMGEEEEEEEEGHQDLISGMDVNDKGTLLVSCSIDGTVRVWDVLVTEFGNDACQPGSKGKGKGIAAKEGLGFLGKVDKFGCPVRARRLLTGHVGWVNAVAIEDITVVSGGSDHTVRIWDALSGSLLRLIPDLFTTRDLDLGVFTVAIHKALPCSAPITTSESGIVAGGSVIEGYQLFSLSTGDLVMELDEPLTSRQHTEFETELYQQYAAKVVITETVVVTNSKLRGMLCVWCRRTGELLYRIRVCPPSTFGEGGVEKQQRKRRKMVSCGLSESSRIASNLRRLQGEEEEEDGETIHTFKVNKSGSMLMCTLCDGRVALFEFGKSRKCAIETEEEVMVVSMLDCIDSRRRSGSDFGGVAIVGEDNDVVGDDQQYFLQGQEQHPTASATPTPTAIPTAGAAVVQEEVEGVEEEGEEGEGSGYACGGEMLAWIWFRDQCDNQRVVLM